MSIIVDKSNHIPQTCPHPAWFLALLNLLMAFRLLAIASDTFFCS